MTPFRALCKDRNSKMHIIQGMVCNDKYLIHKYKTPYCVYVTEKVIEPKETDYEAIAHRKTSKTNSIMNGYAIITYNQDIKKYVIGGYDIQGDTLEAVMRKYTHFYIENADLKFVSTL